MFYLTLLGFEIGCQKVPKSDSQKQFSIAECVHQVSGSYEIFRAFSPKFPAFASLRNYGKKREFPWIPMT